MILERIVSGLSFYLIPFTIGLLSLTALLIWDDEYAAKPEMQLEIRALSRSDGSLSLSEVRSDLALVPSSTRHDNKLSESPVWFGFMTGQASDSSKIVEFPSRHALDMTCWDGESKRPLGHSSSADTNGQVGPVKAGFFLSLQDTGPEIICRTSFVGPARLTARLWSADELKISSQDFHRNSGLLDGGIVVLTVFVLAAALINRERLYLIFAAWLLLSLRVGATSGGWDSQWLNHTVPSDWLTLGRSLTLASYATMTLTLYRAMFQNELEKTSYRTAIKFCHWLCIPLLICAALMPRSLFIQTVWVLAGPGLVLMMLSLMQIVVTTRSRVALWYGASLSITFVSSLSEILAAATGLSGLIGALNSVTAALASGLLASIAIAQQMRQEHDKRLELQAELEHTFEAMPIGLFTLDLNGRFTSANPALFGMLSPKVLTPGGNVWQQYFTDGAWTRMHQMVIDNTHDEMEITGRPRLSGGNAKRFLVKATLARGKIEGSLQDVTEKSLATDNLQFLANHDSLTKILNRRGIERAVNHAIASQIEENKVAMAYLDLDRFKLINDLHGHGIGDEVLQQVCDRVSGTLTKEVQFGRVGGDEFVIVFANTRIAFASLVCRGIIDSICGEPYRVGEKAFHVRVSIGLIEISEGMQFNEAMSAADRACREAKGRGDGSLVIYEKDASAFQQHETELKLIDQLTTGVAENLLYLEMQPIMSLTDPHESLNFEVLLRMRSATGAVVPTYQLIAAGESSGRMSMIDRWVLSSALGWLNKHRQELKKTKFVCINLSGASLNDEKFLEDVYAMLEQDLTITGMLCLEITESVALHDLQKTRRFVDRVRGYGAKVALDDFGAGYTSFSYLKEFTADLLKIDGSFIVNMNQHPANIAIVEAIVNLARNLGMKVIAEWAEDNETVQTLSELGVDYVQGFVVARPQAAEVLVLADSGASFINDKALAQYVAQLGKSDATLAPVDLFAAARADRVH